MRLWPRLLRACNLSRGSRSGRRLLIDELLSLAGYATAQLHGSVAFRGDLINRRRRRRTLMIELLMKSHGLQMRIREGRVSGIKVLLE